MQTTETELVEVYGRSNPHERFDLIYKNYEVFMKLVDCFETGLFNRILYEREYNLRSRCSTEELGVRISTNRISDTTATKAIERIMIRDAIENENYSGDILKDTDNPDKHRQDIHIIRMMRREFEVFDSCLKALPSREFKVTYSFINKEKKITEIAEDEDKAYQTVKNLVCTTRRTLEARAIPSFRERL